MKLMYNISSVRKEGAIEIPKASRISSAYHMVAFQSFKNDHGSAITILLLPNLPESEAVLSWSKFLWVKGKTR